MTGRLPVRVNEVGGPVSVPFDAATGDAPAGEDRRGRAPSAPTVDPGPGRPRGRGAEPVVEIASPSTPASFPSTEPPGKAQGKTRGKPPGRTRSPSQLRAASSRRRTSARRVA
ncbi:hypothetical protein GCM10010405_40560 [Streptomyces macrosporus]|uniref:Uncharacterized protein n=1 Tax=Streptomyces macrosporus TaxID=44032 RepID=A0ABP5XD19_9ACTN